MNNINIFNHNNKNNEINIKLDNNNNDGNFNNSEDEFYEDKNEKEIYYRMNIENSKIKIELNKIKEFHSKKIKSLDKNELSFIDIKNDYIENIILPEVKVYEDEKKDKIINLMNTEYLLKEKPETGSCLILEIENDNNNNNNNLNIIGVNEKYFQIGNLLKQQKIKSNIKNNNKSDKKLKNNNIKTKNKISNNNINNNNINNNNNNNINNNNINNNNINNNITENNNKFIGKKRKKSKRKYIKESTIIKIKKIQ